MCPERKGAEGGEAREELTSAGEWEGESGMGELIKDAMAGRGSGYYTAQPRPEMFQSQSSQLPPPSQLHQLASSSSFQRENQLAPISSSNRFPPASYHPSLSSQGLPSIPSAQPWQTHRTSSSRDDRYPSPNDTPQTPAPSAQPPQPERRDSQSEKATGGEENLPSTSDFVKKLYKYVSPHSLAFSVPDRRPRR